MAKVTSLRCPTCKTIVLAGSEDFPFCSDRCRIIDLGKWASGAYLISSPVHDPDLVDECRSQYVRVIARGVPPQLIVLGRGPGGTDIYLRP